MTLINLMDADPIYTAIFRPDVHLLYVNRWLKARGLPETTGLDLPDLGILASTHMPIAAGFIRTAEGGYGILDSFVTDPEALPSDRDQCLDAVVKALLDVAPSLKISRMLAFSADKNTMSRAKKFGFTIQPHVFSTLSLGQE